MTTIEELREKLRLQSVEQENYNYDHLHLLQVLSETLKEREEYEEKVAILKLIQDAEGDINWNNLESLIISMIRNYGDKHELKLYVLRLIRGGRKDLYDKIEEEFACSGYWRG